MIPPEDFAFSRKVSGYHRIALWRRVGWIAFDMLLSLLTGMCVGAVLAECFRR